MMNRACRYVYLWPARLGYSLSANPGVICNFISLDNVACAEPVDPDGKDRGTKCDFVVRILPNEADKSKYTVDSGGLSSSNEISKSEVPSQRVNEKNSSSPWFALDILQRAFKSPVAATSAGEENFVQRPYFFRASSVTERNMWIGKINHAVQDFRHEQRRQQNEQRDFLLRNQAWVRGIYTSIQFRVGTAFLVGINFLVMVSPPKLSCA